MGPPVDRVSLLFALGRPFGPLYGRFMEIRSWAYRRGYLSVRRLPCKVVSVGNLSLGGTGKTPHVLALARWLYERGRRPVILSRGYGGTAGRGPLVVSDGERVLLSPKVAGDEPVMLASALRQVPVVIGSDRYAAGRLAVSCFRPEVLVLDDAFQHLGLARDVDLVLLPAPSPLGSGRIFPAGELREPPSALTRATALILTDSQLLTQAEQETRRREVQRLVPGRPVFFSEVRVRSLTDMGGAPMSLSRLAGASVAVFCALAHPEGFLRFLIELGADVRYQACYRDHHLYTARDLERLLEQGKVRGATALVTTAKDAVKVRPSLGGERIGGRDRMGRRLPIWVLEIESRPEVGLWNFVEAHLSALGGTVHGPF